MDRRAWQATVHVVAKSQTLGESATTCAACGSLVPHQGLNPLPLQWNHGGLTTGPPLTLCD